MKKKIVHTLHVYIFAGRLLSSCGLYWVLIPNGDALPFGYQVFTILALATTALFCKTHIQDQKLK